jgi:hypothetical protein
VSVVSLKRVITPKVNPPTSTKVFILVGVRGDLIFRPKREITLFGKQVS